LLSKIASAENEDMGASKEVLKGLATIFKRMAKRTLQTQHHSKQFLQNFEKISKNAKILMKRIENSKPSKVQTPQPTQAPSTCLKQAQNRFY
jgi:hypothetical protein